MINQQSPIHPKRNLLLLVLYMTLIVAACSQLSMNQVGSIEDYWKCLPPIEKFGYSISATAEPIVPRMVSHTLPEGWEPQLSWEQQQEISSPSGLVYFAESIWMITDSKIARYQPKEHSISTYTVKVDEQSEFIPRELFVSSNQVLWGIENLGLGVLDVWPSHTGKFLGIFSRYDPEVDRFQPVIDRDGVLVHGVGDIVVDEDNLGNFWITQPNKNVSRFNPDTLKAEIVLDQTSGYSFFSLVVGPEGKIWLSAEPTREPSNDLIRENELVRYDPESGALKSFGIPPGWENTNLNFQLYLDRQGRIWTGGEWLEKTAGGYEWFTLVPQPEFLTPRTHYKGLEFSIPKYSVDSPHIEFQASDGSMWFIKGGLFRADPESGEWCKITNFLVYHIIEDDEGNLWIAQGNQLYKKSLNP